MRKKLNFAIYTLMFLAIAVSGCDKLNNGVKNPERFAKIFMPQAVKNPIVYNFMMSDTAQTIVYGANYGGPGYPSEDINVKFAADTSLTAKYNLENGTSYISLPGNSFEFEQTVGTIAKGELSTKPLKLKIKTFGVLQPSLKYILPVRITMDNADSIINADLSITYFIVEANFEEIHVFMPQAENNPVSYNFNISDSAPTIAYSAQYSGVDPEKDVSVTFMADNSLTDSFNFKNGTNYPSMPVGSYEMNPLTAKILQGSSGTDLLKIKVKTNNLVLFKKYLLPVRISNATADLPAKKRLIIDNDKSITYFLVEVTPNGVELTVMSYGKGSGYNDMQALANSIAVYNPDLLVVRELDVNTTRSGPMDQPQKIAELLGMPYYVFANALNYQGGEYGSAVFSKFPIEGNETKTYMLPSSSSEKGPLAIIKVKIKDTLSLYFAGVHLNANATIRNTMQAPTLLDIMKNYTGPLILAGNFNSNPSDMSNTYGQMITQFTFPCTTCPPNYSASNPTSYSDFVMYKPGNAFEVLDYKVGSSSVSTHLPVILKLKWFY